MQVTVVVAAAREHGGRDRDQRESGRVAKNASGH
jgi:hypothetical protein